ncbi:MAG: hypothetical protein LWW94_09925 [Candidatus Desulfofervidaceae bacterium]|nr:hypothetical protein [Candidatus Desulfofervidaceae bacterium]
MEYRDLGIFSLEELTPEFFQDADIESLTLSLHCTNNSTAEYCFRADYQIKNDKTKYFSLV